MSRSTPLARDMLGGSKFLQLTGRSPTQKKWVLEWLEKYPAPYSAATVDNREGEILAEGRILQSVVHHENVCTG